MTERSVLNLKRVFKKNQIVLTLLAVMIVVAVYLDYIGKESIPKADANTTITDISEQDVMAENQ